jgi:CheY-like chemotaxis protein
LRLKTIPALRASRLSAVQAGSAQPGRRRVLVVDDNVDHAESMATLLRLDGHEVHTAHDGLEGLAAFAAVRPDVVLLDIGMPGLDGYETARRIRTRGDAARCKLIALSGWGQSRDRQLSEKAGFDHHLVKPVEPAELQRLFAQVDLPAHGRDEARGDGRRRVLLVDDNADLRASLAAILQQLAECEIRSAPDGVQAIAVALDWRPDVVFVDIHMPRMNGFQVAKKLRERFLPGSMKLILMSGVAIDETLARDAKQAGFDACIDKVAEPDLWLRHLDPALAR